MAGAIAVDSIQRRAKTAKNPFCRPASRPAAGHRCGRRWRSPATVRRPPRSPNPAHTPLKLPCAVHLEHGIIIHSLLKKVHHQGKVTQHHPRAKKASPPRKFNNAKASPAPESTVLFVEPLSRNVDETRLYQIFAYFGEVANVQIPMNETANLPHDYGYIHFKKRADAERALRYMDGGQIDGNDVKLSFVVAPQKQDSSSMNAHPNGPKADAPQNDKVLLLKRMLSNILGNHLRQEKNLLLCESGLLHIKGLRHPTVNLRGVVLILLLFVITQTRTLSGLVT
ncbi:hypothetical protein BRADI_5g07505v3 [Brachypodium distachyon]|uniref:RRM domain-containing protein n=1 Tax=Brachypodium distachyon TaxID=15368 RepID=A0A2K2CFS5_BRADI|nr:hypothetical protein BRADI_5g07505v3 [Brachypodium distachyon]